MKYVLIRTRAATILLVCFALVSYAGVRAPGTYHGVVIFDRWDSCYLYSGTYLMYVSEKIKEQLRPFAGRPVIADVQQIFQPMNPGDGLIQKIESVKPDFPSPDDDPPTSGVELRVRPAFVRDQVRFILEISNTSGEPIRLSHSDLAVTVLRKKQDRQRDDFDPSDGLSTAALTRFAVWDSGSGRIRESKRVAIKSSDLQDMVTLSPREKEALDLELKLTPGKYELLAGYGGGVHESVTVVSNSVRFDVPSSGSAQVRP